MNNCFGKIKYNKNTLNPDIALYRASFVSRGKVNFLERFFVYIKLSLLNKADGTKRFSNEEVKTIISTLRKGDNELLRILLSEKDHWENERFRYGDIIKILKSNKNREIVKSLISARVVAFNQKFEIPTLSGAEIISILSNLNNNNIELLSKLLKAKTNKIIKSGENNIADQFQGYEIVEMVKKCRIKSKMEEYNKILSA